MSVLTSKLATRQMQWTANMTEQTHLGKALLTKPAVFLPTFDKLFSAQNYYSDNPLTSELMKGSKTNTEIGQTEWEWEMKGANTKPLVVIENVLPSTETRPGLHKTNFRIKLDENHYVPGDVITPGTSDKRYQSRVQEGPTPNGNGYIYVIRLMSEDDQLFLPVQYLKPGTQWAKLYSQYEEAAEQGGSTTFSTNLALKNKMSKYRKTYSITDYASTEVLAVKIADSKGKLHDSWIRYAEVEYWQQWYRELERGAWYSRSTDTVIGANGRPVRSGAGVQEMLEDSHIHRYNILTGRLIEEYLMDIFYSRVKPGKGRQIKGYTGEYGMLQFHRAIQNWVERSGFIKNVEVFTNKVTSDYHTNALEAGYQYVKYHMANGSSLELVHNPLYDDRDINFEIDPITGFPVESQRITFLDFSNDGGANVKLVNKKDGFAFGYREGLYGPYGPKKGGSMAHTGSYYDMVVEKSFGTHIDDITRCGELILSRN